MNPIDPATLTERQRREYEYHRQRAGQHESLVHQPLSWDVLQAPESRWWNAYWRMYAHLSRLGLQARDVLVVGCGFGEDALRLARMGACVTAFDLSPEAIDIAQRRAQNEELEVAFHVQPAESLDFADASFDCVVARDILHHVDIPRTMIELRRVARADAVFVMNEIYTHSALQRIRTSGFVERYLYDRMKTTIYGTEDVYITADERKLDESDLAAITAGLGTARAEEHFNMLVTRIVPDRFDTAAKLDRLALKALRPLGRILAGRVLLVAPFLPPAGIRVAPDSPATA